MVSIKETANEFYWWLLFYEINQMRFLLTISINEPIKETTNGAKVRLNSISTHFVKFLRYYVRSLRSQVLKK